ncbi:MAG TPA: ATP-binding protein [Vicinamibacterales bacterium]|jgi:PAS domain S-box-containing protein|nr:ATP-binding protein [Vicinamibacterales bacterium]
MKLRYDRRILWLAFAAGVPGTLVAFILLWLGGYSLQTFVSVGLAIAAFWAVAASALRHRVVFPLQTMANLLEALRESDFSFRARGAKRDDPLGETLFEINALADTLRDERLGSLEATALLRTVMAEIDVAVFTFDDGRRLTLVNRAGERLLGRPAEQLLGKKAEELDLSACLDGTTPQVLNISFAGGTGQWEVRRGAFRQGGLPHQLVVLSDMSVPLRQQEREAWHRLIRVLGHELNNSLAPIKSIAGSLEQIAAQDPLPGDWRDDMRRGLGVIAGRADALGRFTSAYTALARLPKPNKRHLDLQALLQRVARLETRKAIRVGSAAEPVTIEADPDQLEQLLINLVRNAVDAALETGGEVDVTWRRNSHRVWVLVEDEGPGLANTANLFVPFFTTKQGGSGIGLVLSRQIAEAHGGTLALEPRDGARGARATVTLPIRTGIA